MSDAIEGSKGALVKAGELESGFFAVRTAWPLERRIALCDSEADAERLAAVWNACVGIEDPAALRRQRDEAQAALRRIATILDEAHERTFYEGYQQTPISQELRNGDIPEIHALAKPYGATAEGAS